MTARRGIAVAMALLGWGVSCGSSTVQVEAPPDPGVTAGARLRPVMAVGDGAEAFLHWYDSELGVECTFARDEDGARRCLPRYFVVFADADCTQTVVLSSCDSTATYGVLPVVPPGSVDLCDPDRDPNEGRHRTYQVTGAPHPATAYHWGAVGYDGQIACEPEPRALRGNQVLLPASPVSLTSFVEATIGVEDGGERLGRRLLTATDGATEIWSAFDHALGVPCSPGSFVTGAESRCRPQFAPQVGGLFADPSCSVPAVAAECGHHAILVESLGFCEPPRLYAPGDEIAAAYRHTGESCEPATGWDGPFFTVGAPLSPDVLPAVTLAREGAGRIRTNIQTNAAGRAVAFAQRRLFDAEIDEPCEPVDFGEAGARCLPRTRFVPAEGAWFADPGCSEPVGRELVGTCGENPQSRFWWVDGTVCTPEAIEIRESVGLVSTAYTRDGGDCVPVSIADDEVAVALGPPTSIDAFPRLELLVR